MKPEEIKKFPALMGDKSVAEEVKTFEFMLENLKTVEVNLDSFIKTVQKDCQHIWREEKKYDKHITSCSKNVGNISFGMMVLDSRTCTLCGLHEKRPPGSSCKVCYSCWSEMKYHSTIPGQGEHTSVFECTNLKCNSGSWHT